MPRPQILAFPPRGKVSAKPTEEGHRHMRACFAPHHVILSKRGTAARIEGSLKTKIILVISTSSSLAYAVSILPNGKMLDLQGGSSSSQKSRSAAIFGSPVFSRDERSLKTILEKGKTTLLPFSPYSGELHAERVKPPRVL